MLNKLLKYDLKRNYRLLCIMFLSTLVISGINRGCKELGESVAFFKLLSIIFDSVFYTLAINCLIQPFLRNFLNFTKSFYSDESYLTHTLPVTKNQLINSKYLTALIELVSAFIVVIVSLLIVFATPTMDEFLKLFLSTVISGSFSWLLVISLMIILVIVEFLLFISIIFYSIVLAYKSKEKRVFKAFLYTAGFAFASLIVLSNFMIIVLVANNVSLSSSTLILSNTAFFGVVLTGIAVYLTGAIVFYFLTKREFKKGVNVD
jgi:hypothetical protein